MSFLGRVGAAVGIGAARVSVVAAGQSQYRGSTVRGNCTLEGGTVEQEIRALTVDLVEFWVTGSGKNRTHHQRSHGRQTLAEGLTVAPGFRQEFGIEQGLPADARCSRRSDGWLLRAEAHVPWAVDARADYPLRVVPHAEVLAVQRAARDALGLVPAAWDGSGARVRYDFASPPWLKDRLDGVSFRLEVIGDVVVGDMVLNRQEHGFGDVLRSAIGADRESIPLQIPRAELRHGSGSPKPAGAYPYLKQLFEELGVVVPGDVAAG